MDFITFRSACTRILVFQSSHVSGLPTMDLDRHAVIVLNSVNIYFTLLAFQRRRKLALHSSNCND